MLFLYLSPIVRHYAAQYVQEQSDGVYTLDSLEIDWYPFTSGLQLSNVHIRCDSLLWQQRIQAGQAVPPLMDSYLPSIRLQGLWLWKLLRSQQLHVGRLLVERPRFVLYSSSMQAQAPASLLAGSSRPALRALSIGAVNIRQGTLLQQAARQPAPDTLMAHIHFQCRRFEPDSLEPFALVQALRQAQAHLSANWVGPGPLPFNIGQMKMQLSLQQGEMDWGKSVLRLQQVEVFANDTTAGMALQLRLPNIELIEPDLFALLKAQALQAAMLHLSEPELLVWGKAGGFTEPSGPGEVGVPAELLPLRLDSLHITGGRFRHYAHRGSDSLLTQMEAVQLRLEHIALQPGAPLSGALGEMGKSLEVGPFFSRNGRDTHISGQAVHFESDSGYVKMQHVRMGVQTAANGPVYAYLPALQLWDFDPISMLETGQLQLAHARLQQPRLHLFRRANGSHGPGSLSGRSFEGLYRLFEAIAINQLELSGGQVVLDELNGPPEAAITATDISLQVSDFHMKEQYGDTLPFFAEDVQLNFQVEDYAFVLPDSSYALSTRKIGFSARDSLLQLDSLQLIPYFSLQDSGKHVRLQLQLPQLKLRGIDLQQLFFYQRLRLDSLMAANATFHIQLRQDSTHARLPTLAQLELYPHLARWLKSLEVGQIGLTDMEVKVENGQGEVFRLPAVSVFARNMQLDSSSYLRPERLFYSEQFQLRIRQLGRLLPDSLHYLSLGEIGYHAHEGYIYLDSIRISPLHDGPEVANAYDIAVPHLYINGFDPLELLQQQLHLDAVQLRNPRIFTRSQSEEVKRGLDSLARANLYELIEAYLQELKIDKLILLGGELMLQQQQQAPEEAFRAREVFVMVRGFVLDSAARAQPGKLFYADDIDVGMDASNYSFVLPDSTYMLQVGHIGLSTGDSRVLVSDLHLSPIAGSQAGLAPLSWEVEVPQLQLSGLNPKEWYLDGRLNLQQLRLQKPSILMRHQQLQPAFERNPYQVYAFFRQHFSQFSIADLLIDRASFREIRHPADTLRGLQLEQLSIRALGVKPDSSDFLSPDHLFYSRDVRISVKNYDFEVDELLYKGHVKELGLHTASKELYARGLEFVPQLDQATFFARYGYARDHLEFRLPDVKVERLDLDALFQNRSFLAGKLLLQGLDIQALKDKHFPEKPDKRPPMPQQVIRELPFALRLDTVEIADGKVFFQQKVPGLKKNARFEVSEMYGRITHINNDSISLIAARPVAVFNAQARLMQTGQLDITFRFPLADTSNAYEFEGRVSRMNLDEFNPLLEQTAFVFVTDGVMDKASFQVKADYLYRKKKAIYVYRGKMRMHYHDLRLQVIDKKSMFEEGQYDAKKMASFFANTFVRKNNPGASGRFLRVGKIYYKRELNKGIAGHWVQAVISGVRSSVGLQNKDQRERLIDKLRKSRQKRKLEQFQTEDAQISVEKE